MIIASSAEELAPLLPQGSVVAWGNFDGVHLGHQTLLAALTAKARELGLPSVVVTFDPRPKTFFRQHAAPKAITDNEDRLSLLKLEGVDYALLQRFDASFAAQSALEFVDGLLSGKLKARALVLGYDTAFGKNREGNFEYLNGQRERCGFSLTRIAPVRIDGGALGSTLIRSLIALGRLEEIPPLLGRVHSIHGRVTHGKKRGGSLLSIPTANLDPGPLLLPPPGVCACLARLSSGFYAAPTSLGANPSFGEGKVTLEAHLLDFNGDLYGQDLRLYFLKYLRQERRFPDPASLREQILKDAEETRRISDQAMASPDFAAMFPL